MTDRIDRFVLIVASLASLSCASAPLRVDVASEKQRLRELDRQWQAAAAAKDVSRFASFYAEDASMLSANLPLVKGRANIEAGMREMFSTPGLVFSFNQQLLEVASGGDMAYDIGSVNVSFDTPGGRVNSPGKYLVVWKKVNGEWKAVADANSTNDAPPEPTPVEIERSNEAFTTSPNSSLGWGDFAAPGFPPGAKIARMHGDPSKTGDHVYRLKFPAGYVVPPHLHPGQAEHITVLSGNFQFGIGERADQTQMVSFGPGDFIYVPARAPHMATFRTETVLQVHGMGPTTRVLVP